MISFRGFDPQKHTVVLRWHAMLRALERGVDPDGIERIVRTGTIRRFGKHGIKVSTKGKRITCVCEVKGDEIIVLTVETD